MKSPLWVPIYISSIQLKRVCYNYFLLQDFTVGMLEGFGPLKKILKPDAVLLVFCYAPSPKRRKTSEA